jgi:hypothetical protein
VNGEDVLKIGLLFFVVGAMLRALHKICSVRSSKPNTVHTSEGFTEHDVRHLQWLVEWLGNGSPLRRCAVMMQLP